MWQLWLGFKLREPTALLGGVYADKKGYHNYRNALSAGDYSVGDVAADRAGPGNFASALDITLKSAQMRTYTKRLDVAARARDPRLFTPRGVVLREFIGTLDGRTVYCYVLTGGRHLGLTADSGPDPGRDKTHLWHIHLSVIRKFCADWHALDGVLSVLRGETLASWRARTEDNMSTADVQAIRGDLGRLAQVLMTGRQNAVFNTVNHPWIDDLTTYDLAKLNAEAALRDAALLAAVQGLDTSAVLARIDQRAGELAEAVGQIDENVVAALPGRTDGDLVELLRQLLGEARAEQVARLLLGE